MFEKLLDLGDRYAEESTWKDFALVKFCLFSMGLAAGCFVAEKHRKKVVCAAAAVFGATYVPLMAKVVRIAMEDDSEDSLANEVKRVLHLE